MPWDDLSRDVAEVFEFLTGVPQVSGRFSAGYIFSESYDTHAARVKEYRASPRGRPRVSETNHRYYASPKGRLAQETKNAKRRAARAAEKVQKEKRDVAARNS